MAIVCELCSKIRSVVYCQSDAAFLCLSCDRKIHAANALSKRHFRTLLCHGCTIEPAAFSCKNHNLCFCHNCDRQSHSDSPQHTRTSINYYMGCPSATELAELWSCELDGLCCHVKKGSDVPGIGWVDSIGLESILNSLAMAAGDHAGLKDSLVLRMEPFPSLRVDLLSSSQRNSAENTTIFDPMGSAGTMAAMKFCSLAIAGNILLTLQQNQSNRLVSLLEF